MVFLSRLIAALAYAGAAFLFGATLGQRGELGVVQHLFTYTIPLTTAVLMLFAKRGRPQVVVTGLAMFAGLYLGQVQFARAWDECATRGFVVRDALIHYRAAHEDYPARLGDLGIPVPCRAGFRPTILHYLSNDRGFRLWMTNEKEVVAFGDVRGINSSGRSSIQSVR
ncbi:MAG: hypothetical protein ABI779_12895 [Acidobacteriota bacterium]